MILIEQRVQVGLLLLTGHLLLFHSLNIEWQTSLASQLLTLMLMLRGLIAALAPVNNIAWGGVRAALLMRARINPFVHINQALFALDALHIRLPDQLISCLRWSLPLRHFGFGKLVCMRCIAPVTLLAEGEVVALLAVKSVVAFFDRLHALITDKPHLVALSLMPLIRWFHCFLLQLSLNFTLEIPVNWTLKILVLK